MEIQCKEAYVLTVEEIRDLYDLGEQNGEWMERRVFGHDGPPTLHQWAEKNGVVL
jgi:hypothetical protein